VKIWVNGKFLEKDAARLSVTASSLHYGTSIFDGIVCIGLEKSNYLFRLTDHLERLLQSASLLGFKTPYPLPSLAHAVSGLIKINKIESCYIRPLVFSNTDYTRLMPSRNDITVALMCEPFNFYSFVMRMKRPLKMAVVENAMIFHDERLALAKVSGKYLNSALALLRAKNLGFDDAVMVDGSKAVFEATSSNIFLVKGRTLKTPSKLKALNGIVRDSVIRIAKDYGYDIIEDSMILAELYEADEVFATNTARGIVSIKQIGQKKIIDTYKRGVCKQIRKAYIDILTGKTHQYREWLTVFSHQNNADCGDI
jgi:branched-chain amino acid aminotransferase